MFPIHRSLLAMLSFRRSSLDRVQERHHLFNHKSKDCSHFFINCHQKEEMSRLLLITVLSLTVSLDAFHMIIKSFIYYMCQN